MGLVLRVGTAAGSNPPSVYPLSPSLILFTTLCLLYVRGFQGAYSVYGRPEYK